MGWAVENREVGKEGVDCSPYMSVGALDPKWVEFVQGGGGGNGGVGEKGGDESEEGLGEKGGRVLMEAGAENK